MGHIEDIVVDKEARGHNLGKIIVETLANTAKAYGDPSK